MRYLIMALLVSVMALAGCKKKGEETPEGEVAPMSEAVEAYL